MRSFAARLILWVLCAVGLMLSAALLRPSVGAAWPVATPVGVVRQLTGTKPAVPSTQPLYLGMDAYRHLDKLSYLEIGDRVWGQTTADPGGGNADNIQVLRVLTDGRRVLFDQLGPGVMTFMRHQEDIGSPWKLYLDGQLTADVAPADLGQITPTLFPARAFPYPLSMNLNQTRGSSILAASIPFSGSMTWAATNPNGNFYSLYRKLPYGTDLSTWTGSEPTGDVVDLLRRAGTDIAPTDIYSRSGTTNLLQGETTIATLQGQGPGQIRAIKLRAAYGDKVRFANTRLLIYWDGEATPSVDAPLKFLAGDGAGVYQPQGRGLVDALLMGAGGDGSTYMDFNLYWPMPFTQSARIAIRSDAATPINGIMWSVRYEPFPDPPAWWGHFHATYTTVTNPVPGQDMTFLNVTGSGRVVGTVVNFSTVDSALEGDPHFFIDGNNTPQIQVTGTEEWGTGGDYWHFGVQTSLPMGGHPSSTNNPPGEDTDGAALYRLLVADSVPFNNSIVLRWEHGGENEVSRLYRACVMWYGNPAQTALPGDELLVGDDASRAAHGYQSVGESRYSMSAAYEYPVHNPVSADTGISMTGVSSFTMALDPRNAGAFLRRKFDYRAANQRANIFIDGQPAGTWYTAGYSDRIDMDGQPRRWREEEFPLPAALTAGKSSVNVRIEFVPTTDPPNSVWTAFRYSIYSFVMPPDALVGTPTSTATPPMPTLTPTPTPVTSTRPTSTPTRCPNPFQDVSPTDYFYGAVSWLWCRTAITGYGDMFYPYNYTTRGQLTKIVVLANGFPIDTRGGPHFLDVPGSNPFYAYIETAYNRGFISGYDDSTFRWGSNVTRGQVAKIVTLAQRWPIVANTPHFSDVPESDPFFAYVETARNRGVISGYAEGTFRPGNPATRGQLSKVVYNAIMP